MKLDESCVIVDNGELFYVSLSHDVGRHRSCKVQSSLSHSIVCLNFTRMYPNQDKHFKNYCAVSKFRKKSISIIRELSTLTFLFSFRSRKS